MKKLLNQSKVRSLTLLFFCSLLAACDEKATTELKDTTKIPDAVQKTLFGNDLLIKKGIVSSINEVKTEKGALALIKATKEADKDVVKLLLAAGVNVNHYTYDKDGSALIVAASNGNLEILRALTEAGADVNIGKGKRGTALMRAAEEGRIKCVKFLISQKADINACDQESNTALMLASKNGKVKCLKLLLEARADIKAKSRGGDSAVTNARRAGYKECLDALVAAGANPNEKDCADIEWACRKNHLDCLQDLLHTGTKNKKELENALRFAKSLECLICLHKAGADLNAKDDRGNTILIEAAFYNRLDILDYLLKNGVNVNLQGELGKTALHWAAYYGHKDAIIKLLTYGADLSILADKGDSVYESALVCCNHKQFDTHSKECMHIILRRDFDVLKETNIDAISSPTQMKRGWWSEDGKDGHKIKRPLPVSIGVGASGVCIFSPNKNFIKSRDGRIFSTFQMDIFENIVYKLALRRAEKAASSETARGWRELANYVKTHDFSSDPVWLCSLAAIFELAKDDLLNMIFIEDDEIQGKGIYARELPHVKKRTYEHLEFILVEPTLLFKNTPQIYPVTIASESVKDGVSACEVSKKAANVQNTGFQKNISGVALFRDLRDNVRIAFWAEYLNKSMKFMETDSRGWIKGDATFVAPDGNRYNYFVYRNSGAVPQLPVMWGKAWEAIEGPDKDAILKAYKEEIETIRRLNASIKINPRNQVSDSEHNDVSSREQKKTNKIVKTAANAAGVKFFQGLSDNVRIAFWVEYLNSTMKFMETDSHGWIKRDATFVAPDGSINNFFDYRNRGSYSQIQTKWKQAWDVIYGPDRNAILKAYKKEIETIRRLNTNNKKKRKI